MSNRKLSPAEKGKITKWAKDLHRRFGDWADTPAVSWDALPEAGHGHEQESKEFWRGHAAELLGLS